MNKYFDNIEEILNNQISGFHQLVLSEPVFLSFVSDNFCEMLGYTREELICEHSDKYIELVHPQDQNVYADFLSKLSENTGKLSVHYRLLKKNGEVIYVNDSSVSTITDDGTAVVNSVLADITPIITENENLRFLNETIPCGFLKYTCEKNPKVTYLNEQMMDILRIPESNSAEVDYLEMYRDNVYLMIPMEERSKFSRFLEHVYSLEAPVAGEINVLRCDGTKARLYGWVTKSVNQDGTEEFQSICMDITERYKTKKHTETERYLKALIGIYDSISEVDYSNRTVKCLHENTSSPTWPKNVPMHLEEATENWIERSVCEADRADVRSFFEKYKSPEVRDAEGLPMQIKYRSTSEEGENDLHVGIFLKIDSDISYFCCRSVVAEQETDSLRSENVSLRNMNENMQELVMRFTDGVVAFEIDDDKVKPLYASDNICEFFGYSKDEWISMARTSHSIESFVSKSPVEYEEFIELFENGEAEFEYIDVKTKTPHRIRAVCTHVFGDDSSPRYVLLYKDNEKISAKGETVLNKGHIYIRTFGYFDVFVDDKPIAFRNKKSKELFALLVDRRGGFVTSEEAISFLWEDEPVNSVTLSRYRKVALRLKNILEEYGISDIVESVDGKRRIVTEKVRCDLFDYLSNREEYATLFKGSYLTNYSWGENTLGELMNEMI